MLKVRADKKHPGQAISARELYHTLDLNPLKYNRWLKKNIIENITLIEGVDYVQELDLNNHQKGRQPVLTLITPVSAISLCVLSKTSKAQKIKSWIIEIFDL